MSPSRPVDGHTDFEDCGKHPQTLPATKIVSADVGEEASEKGTSLVYRDDVGFLKCQLTGAELRESELFRL